jgi:lipopolysaccharide transport system ATP-binding protein
VARSSSSESNVLSQISCEDEADGHFGPRTMSDVAIRVSNLGKSYRLYHQTTPRRYKTLRDDLLGFPGKLWQSLSGKTGKEETFWALDDLSFSVRDGEVLGVIGRNGAGKSTLLKILSRITEPSCGEAEIQGRVGSLLEVGTGFHPELTGRENVFLSGAILGMRRAEIRRNFHAIVDFAEIEQFIDTPVKHYSSGMYMRLAFSVAAHLEPEILIVDEVLAVGDLAFQKKCLEKMGDVSRSGRTVLFVSHNMEAIENLCSRALWLDRGKIRKIGLTEEIVRNYIAGPAQEDMKSYQRTGPPPMGQEGWIESVQCADRAGKPCTTFLMGDLIRFLITVGFKSECSNAAIGLAIINDRGQHVAAPNSAQQMGPIRVSAGSTKIECVWEGPILTPKRYHIRVDLGTYYSNLEAIEEAAMFTIEPADVFGTGTGANPNLAVVSQCRWSM